MRKPRQTLALGLTFFACLATATTSSGPRTYNATLIGDSRFSATAVALNDRGEVVGQGVYAERVPGALAARHICPVYYKSGTLISIEIQIGAGSYVWAINNSGWAVGHFDHTGPTQKGFLFLNNRREDIGHLGGQMADAMGLNNKCDVVGLSYVDDRDWHAILYQKGTLKDLGTLGGKRSQACAINDAGQIVGWSDLANHATHGFLYSDGKMSDIGTLGGFWSDAKAINGKGDVVGEAATKNGPRKAFLFSNGKMSDLDPEGTLNSKAEGINDSGQAVGQILRQSQRSVPMKAALFENGKAYDLNTLIANIPENTYLQQDPLVEAVAINASGQIVANSSQGRSYLLTPARK